MASSMCLGLRVPTIATWTAGLARVQAIASRDGGTELHLGETGKSVHDAQVAAVRLAFEHVVLGAPVAGRELRLRSHGAAQQPVCERPIDQHTYIVSACVRKDRRLDVAPEEVVGRLQRLDLQAAAELFHLLGIEVGYPDVADLSSGHRV